MNEYICKVHPKRAEDHWEFMEKVEELVRCKDCKYFDDYNVECEKGHKQRPKNGNYSQWFCADGEKKSSEQDEETDNKFRKPIGRFNRELNEWFYWCPYCDGHFDKDDKFCRHCGRKQNWEHGISEIHFHVKCEEN